MSEYQVSALWHFYNLTKSWNVTGLLYLHEQRKRPKVEFDLKVKQQKVGVSFICHGPRLPSDLSLHIVGLSNLGRPFQSPFYFALVDYVAKARKQWHLPCLPEILDNLNLFFWWFDFRFCPGCLKSDLKIHILLLLLRSSLNPWYTWYRACHRFRFTTKDDYFRGDFEHFWSKHNFLRHMGQ